MKLFNRKGQSAIEMAIALPILLLILFSIIYFGIFVYNKTVVLIATNKALDAGLGVRLNGMDAEKDADKENNRFLEERTAEDEAYEQLKLTLFTDTHKADYNNTNDNRIVTMEVSVKFKMSLPIVSSMINDNNTIKSRSVYKENKPVNEK